MRAKLSRFNFCLVIIWEKKNSWEGKNNKEVHGNWEKKENLKSSWHFTVI